MKLAKFNADEFDDNDIIVLENYIRIVIMNTFQI